MDPNAELKRLRELATSIIEQTENNTLDAIEMAEAFDDLDNWLTSKGFKPDDWK